MSSQTAHAVGNSNIIVQASGSGNTINVASLAYLTLISPLRSQLPAPKKDLDLLNPVQRAIPLTGRDQDLHDLRAWLNAPHAVSLRTLTGAGGSGKTRLALELIFEAAAYEKNPWDAGFLTDREARRFLSAQNVSTWGWQRNTFAVIDYAATFTTDLRVLLAELSRSESAPDHPRLRILLLERHASVESGWYSSLHSGSFSDAVKELFHPWEPSQIQPVGTVAQRYSILCKTIEQAAPLLHDARSPHGTPPFSVPVLTPELEGRLKESQWADPLMLMMAAHRLRKRSAASPFALPSRNGPAPCRPGSRPHTPICSQR